MKQKNVSATHLLFVLFGIFGGLYCVMFTPQLLLGPTILLGGLLFLGFAAVLSYRPATQVSAGTGFLNPILPSFMPTAPAPTSVTPSLSIVDNTMRSESEMAKAAQAHTDAAMPAAAKICLTLFGLLAVGLIFAALR